MVNRRMFEPMKTTRDLRIVRLAGAMHAIIDGLVEERAVSPRAWKIADRANKRLNRRLSKKRQGKALAPLIVALAAAIMERDRKG
jgi:hypothetical protein